MGRWVVVTVWLLEAVRNRSRQVGNPKFDNLRSLQKFAAKREHSNKKMEKDDMTPLDLEEGGMLKVLIEYARKERDYHFDPDVTFAMIKKDILREFKQCTSEKCLLKSFLEQGL